MGTAKLRYALDLLKLILESGKKLAQPVAEILVQEKARMVRRQERAGRSIRPLHRPRASQRSSQGCEQSVPLMTLMPRRVPFTTGSPNCTFGSISILSFSS